LASCLLVAGIRLNRYFLEDYTMKRLHPGDVCRATACLTFLLAVSAGPAAAETFIVKFATLPPSGVPLGLYDDHNQEISQADSRPAAACGIGFGELGPPDDLNTSLGTISAAYGSGGTQTNGQPYPLFPNVHLLRVYFTGFGSSCPADKILINYDASPWGFYNGETALLVNANKFRYIDRHGIPLDDHHVSVPLEILLKGVDQDLSLEFKPVTFYYRSILDGFLLRDRRDSSVPMLNTLGEHLAKINRQVAADSSGSIVKPPLETAVLLADRCTEAARYYRDADDGMPDSRKRAMYVTAYTVCAAAADLTESAGFAAQAEERATE
jgi:hypothetical protein